MEPPIGYSTSTSSILDPHLFNNIRFRFAIAVLSAFMITITGFQLARILIFTAGILFKIESDNTHLVIIFPSALLFIAFLIAISVFILGIVSIASIYYGKIHRFSWLAKCCFIIAYLHISYPFIAFIFNIDLAYEARPFIGSFYDFFSLDLLAFIIPFYCGKILSAYFQLHTQSHT